MLFMAKGERCLERGGGGGIFNAVEMGVRFQMQLTLEGG